MNNKIKFTQMCPNKLKNIINKILILFDVINSYYYDIFRYLKYSTTLKHPKTFEQFEARIIAHYHVLEKGLSLKGTRPGYGKQIAESLLKLLKNYINTGYSTDKKSFKTAIDTVNEYIYYNKKHKQDVKNIEYDFLSILKNTNAVPNSKMGGIFHLNKNEILESTKKDFKHFSLNRFSIRNFSSEEIDLNILIDAVKIAQKTPSVCNRQATKVHVIVNSDIIKTILKIQNGNRGFGHLSNKLIVITTDLYYFEGVGERNQAFIDAGMFSMSLLYALHYEGLGACPLNWCVSPNKSKRLRKILKINESETIILIIAIGHIPEKIDVAKATRKNIDEIIRILK